MDEVKAAYENSLVFGKLCKKFNHRGKPGDILHVPDVSNLVATDMTQTGEVVAQSVTESETTVTINKWKDCSFRISDLAKAQSRYDIRSEYTKKAGYAIAKVMETDLSALFKTVFQAYNGGGATADSSGATVTLAGILTAQQYLLGQDVPTTDMAMVIPPSSRTAILQIEQFTSIDYVNAKSIVSGKMGQILGMDVFVSNNCPIDTNTKVNCIVMHKDAIVLAEQLAPRVQSQYELKNKAWLVSCDAIYG